MGATSSLLAILIGVFVILPLTAGIMSGVLLAGGVFIGRVISWLFGKEKNIFLYECGIEGDTSPPKLPQDQSGRKKRLIRPGDIQRR